MQRLALLAVDTLCGTWEKHFKSERQNDHPMLFQISNTDKHLKSIPYNDRSSAYPVTVQL